MELDAVGVGALVDTQVASIADRAVVELIDRLRIVPRQEHRPWDYGAPGEYACWVVLEHQRSNTGIAYCPQGFGPRAPWGLLWLTKHLSMGSDSSWFPTLEEALRDSFAAEEL
jgi:hypothetical protein